MRYNAPVRQEPARPTLNALRAARDARRVATDILLDRVTQLDTVRCVDCGKLVAVRTDASHPASKYEGRVICGVCVRRRRHRDPGPLPYETPPSRIDVEAYTEEGLLILPTEPDPRPSIRDWLRRLFGDDPGRR